MSTPTGFSVALVTAGSEDEAERIAACLVEERLAACVNIVGPIRSIYRWQGEIRNESEVLLVIKMRSDAFDRLKARVGELHSYDTPEIIALPITAGSEPYLRWLESMTSNP